jgi:hypothetical protein
MPNEPAPLPSSRRDVDAFLAQRRQQRQVAHAWYGRLIFAADATMSREPMWTLACRLQSDMFREVAAIGSLDVQLVHYYGPDGFKASPWVSDATALADLMGKIECRSGYTQIAKVLAHVHTENAAQKLSALVFIGDAVEEEPAVLYGLAVGLGVPAFMFLEGDDPHTAKVFQELACLTNGAYCRFDAGAADQLRDLLRAAATYAAGGWKALSASRNAGAVKLLQQQLK